MDVLQEVRVFASRTHEGTSGKIKIKTDVHNNICLFQNTLSPPRVHRHLPVPDKLFAALLVRAHGTNKDAHIIA
jgi:hypothetical protein